MRTTSLVSSAVQPPQWKNSLPRLERPLLALAGCQCPGTSNGTNARRLRSMSGFLVCEKSVVERKDLWNLEGSMLHPMVQVTCSATPNKEHCRFKQVTSIGEIVIHFSKLCLSVVGNFHTDLTLHVVFFVSLRQGGLSRQGYSNPGTSRPLLQTSTAAYIYITQSSLCARSDLLLISRPFTTNKLTRNPKQPPAYLAPTEAPSKTHSINHVFLQHLLLRMRL